MGNIEEQILLAIDDRKEGQVIQKLDISYVYIMHKLETSFYKIGISFSPKSRLRQIDIHPEPVILYDKYEFNSPDAANIERRIHGCLRDAGKHIRYEWFNLEEKDVLELKSVLGKISTFIKCEKQIL